MGIVKFKSKAGADVIMLTQHATAVFAAMGLALSPQGAVEPSLLPVCLQRLHEAVLVDMQNAELEKAEQQKLAQQSQRPQGLPTEPKIKPTTEVPEDQDPQSHAVDLRLRSQPLRKLFEQALQANQPVYWGF